MAGMKQYDDLDSSTRVCPCGASFAWSGFDDGLERWMAAHEGHHDGALTAETTADGERMTGPQPPASYRIRRMHEQLQG